MPLIICKMCGKPFSALTAARKYCDSCRQKRHINSVIKSQQAASKKNSTAIISKQVEKKCNVCGKIFTGTRRKYCSKECENAFKLQRAKKWYSENKGRAHMNVKKWRKNHPENYLRIKEKIRSYNHQYYLKNRKHI